ncbi:MAG: hypothetical protein M0Q15_08015 [Nevskia sp.]|jgi:hypothetical protein|nr:hypothetical protein [Nevskia sp.]
MKKIILAVVLSLGAALPALAADVGVSISIGQPGFYGRIDLGSFPQPEVVYSEPIIIERTRVIHEPLYLRVPPGHQKNWKRYCGRYEACGRPVYFVRDDWYNNVYAPQYRERHRDHDDHGHDDHDRGHDDHDRGHGKEHGHGHD